MLPSTSQQPGAVECMACGATFLNCSDWGGLMSHWKRQYDSAARSNQMEALLRAGLIQLYVLNSCQLVLLFLVVTPILGTHPQTRHAAHGLPARPVQPAPPAPAPRPAPRPASGGKWACSRRALRIYRWEDPKPWANSNYNFEAWWESWCRMRICWWG